MFLTICADDCLFLVSILTCSKIVTSESFFVLITRGYLHLFSNSLPRSKSWPTEIIERANALLSFTPHFLTAIR